MNKEQLTKELNSYSKAEIIEAIVNTDTILTNRITSKLVRNKNRFTRKNTLNT